MDVHCQKRPSLPFFKDPAIVFAYVCVLDNKGGMIKAMK